MIRKNINQIFGWNRVKRRPSGRSPGTSFIFIFFFFWSMFCNNRNFEKKKKITDNNNNKTVTRLTGVVVRFYLSLLWAQHLVKLAATPSTTKFIIQEGGGNSRQRIGCGRTDGREPDPRVGLGATVSRDLTVVRTSGVWKWSGPGCVVPFRTYIGWLDSRFRRRWDEKLKLKFP